MSAVYSTGGPSRPGDQPAAAPRVATGPAPAGGTLPLLSTPPRTTTAAPAAPAAPARSTPRPAATPHPAPKARPPGVESLSLTKRVHAAADYAADHDVRCGIAVLDVESGRYVGGGDDEALFGTASVVKVFIAARLLAEPLSAVSTDRLTEMISSSDDTVANSLWYRAGSTTLVDWVEDRYGLDGGKDDLGTPNTIPRRWGNTHVTARGLVHFYAAAAADDVVGPTLVRAMRDYTHYAVDGTDQRFGLATAAGHPAVKQGWANYSADTNGDATVHTTGLVDGGRFAVAILTEGDHNARGSDTNSMNPVQRAVVDEMTRLLMPKGYIDPSDRPSR